MTLRPSADVSAPHEGSRGGRLRLVFEPGRTGTWLSDRTSVAPVRIHRAFRSDAGDAIVQLLHVGPGMLAGDRIEVDVVVRSGASAVVVPQSALKVHRMQLGQGAEQTLRVRVESGARLELHGGLVIPFPDAEFHQRMQVEVEPGATFLSTDRWTTGRHGADQRSAYRRLTSRIEVRRDGRMLYADALDLEGRGAAGGTAQRRRSWRASRGLDGRTAVATGVMIGEARPEPESERDRAIGHVGESGAYLRALSDDPGTLRAAVFDFADRARRAAGWAPLPYDRYAG